MRAAHAHGTTAEMGDATATEMHGAAAKMGATAAETAAATAEVSAATTAAADMSAATTATATATAAKTATSRVSGCRQTKGKAYCSRARRDFPHDLTSLSGPIVEANARIARPFRRSQSHSCCNARSAYLASRRPNQDADATFDMYTVQQERQPSMA